MLTMASVFTVQSRAAGFARAANKVLTESATRLSRQWRDAPWFFTAFDVGEEIDESLLKVEILETDETITVYSDTIAESYHAGIRRFIALLWYNGLCYQTAGPVVPLTAFDSRDLEFFVESAVFSEAVRRVGPVRAIAETDGGKKRPSVEEVIDKNPVEALALFRFAGAEKISYRGTNLEFAVGWGRVRRDDASGVAGISLGGADSRGAAGTRAPDDSRPGEDSAAAELAEAIAASLSLDFDDLRIVDVPGGFIIVDPEAELSEAFAVTLVGDLVVLNAFTVDHYHALARTIAELTSVPYEPMRACSFLQYTAVMRIFEAADPASAFASDDDRFDTELIEEEAEEVDPETIVLAQEILRRVTEAYNEGVPVDTEAIAEEVDAPLDLVEDLLETYDALLTETERELPPADHLGVPPRAMKELTAGGVPRVEGYLRLREPDEMSDVSEELLSTSWFYRTVRYLLETAVDEQSIKLTSAGYLPTRYLKEIYDRGLVPHPYTAKELETRPDLERYARPKKEVDWISLRLVHGLAEHAGILARRAGALHPAGVSLLRSPAALYHKLLTAAMRSFDYGEYDRVEPIPIVSDSWPFMLYAVRKLSGPTPDAERIPTDDFVDTVCRAFPTLLPASEDPELRWDVESDLRIRFLERFADPFGLIRYRAPAQILPQPAEDFDDIRTAALFDKVFAFEEQEPG
jgi:hypothetical protein